GAVGIAARRAVVALDLASWTKQGTVAGLAHRDLGVEPEVMRADDVRFGDELAAATGVLLPLFAQVRAGLHQRGRHAEGAAGLERCGPAFSVVPDRAAMRGLAIAPEGT